MHAGPPVEYLVIQQNMPVRVIAPPGFDPGKSFLLLQGLFETQRRCIFKLFKQHLLFCLAVCLPDSQPHEDECQD